MGHTLAHGTEGIAISHALLVLVSVWSLDDVDRCEVDEVSVVVGGHVHHDTATSSRAAGHPLRYQRV